MTGQSRDALHKCNIVVYKIFVAGGIELGSITEQLPQLASDCLVPYNHSLKAKVKLMVLQNAITQDANSEWEKRGRHFEMAY